MTNFKQFQFDFRDALALPPSESALSLLQGSGARLEGGLFSTYGRDFQVEILNDFSQEVVVKKISQVGLTVLYFLKCLAFAKLFPGKNIMFTQPTDVHAQAVGQSKMLPILIDNKHLFPKNGHEDQRSAKFCKLDRTELHLLGSKSLTANFSISVDFIIKDEVDESDQISLDNVNSRYQASPLQFDHKLSTPKWSNYGIDAAYERSSKGQWLIKCASCGHYNYHKISPQDIYFGDTLLGLDQFEDLRLDSWERLLGDQPDIHTRCKKCHSPLREDSKGTWVHAYPDKAIRGYEVSPLCLYRLNPVSRETTLQYVFNKFLYYHEKGNITKWKNSVVGEATKIGDAGIGVDLVESLKGNPYWNPDPEEPLYIGIDVGEVCRFVAVTKSFKVVTMQEVRRAQLHGFVKEFLINNKVIAGRIDRYPQISLSESLISLSDGRIQPAHYNTRSENTDDEYIKPEVQGHAGYIKINRTACADFLQEKMFSKEVSFNGYAETGWKTVLNEIAFNFKTTNENGKVSWGCEVPDHFFHALVYAFSMLRGNSTGHGSYTLASLEPTVLEGNTLRR